MRVVGGTAKGRRLTGFRHGGVRPTADRVREAVFDVLGAPFEFERALDIFAGTGAMGIEALSRGAKEAVFIERDQRAVEVIKKNLAVCGFAGRARVIRDDARKALARLSEKGERFDLVILDAPYADVSLTRETLGLIASCGILGGPDGVVVCEASKRHPVETGGATGLELLKEKRYGDTLVYFLKGC